MRKAAILLQVYTKPGLHRDSPDLGDVIVEECLRLKVGGRLGPSDAAGVGIQ